MRNPHAAPSLPFVAPVRLRNLVWLAIVGGAWLTAEVFGTPHLRASYVFTGRPSAPYFRSCSYWGLHPFEVRDAGGHCPIIIMAHAPRNR